MQESVKPVHSRTIAEAVGLMSPPGASALNGVCRLYATDVFHRAIWSDSQFLENADEDARRHFERVCELYSILRLFAPPANTSKQ
jgi:hypothetical protein